MRCLFAVVLFCSLAAAQKNPPRLPDDYAERVAALERQNAQTPDDPEVLEALAGSYAMGERYADALRILRRLVALRPDDDDYRLRLANVYSWSGNMDGALEQTRPLADRGVVAALELQCELLTWKADARGAQACYAKLKSAAKPGSTAEMAAQLGLARNLSWAGRSGPAIRAYREYSRLAPRDGLAATEFARLLMHTGHYSEAERVISAVISADPDNAVALSVKAELLHWAGHRGHEAASLSAEALALNPELPEAQLAAAYALRDVGDRRGATDIFRELQTHVQATGPEKQAAYWGGYEYLRERVPNWGKMQVLLPFTEYNDSDGIHDTSRSALIKLPIGNNAFSISAQEYRSSANPDSIFSFENPIETVRLVSGGPIIHLSRGLDLEASGGVASYRRGFSKGIFSAALTGSPADRWAFSLRAHREVVPVTPRSIAIGLAFTGVDGSAEYFFNSRLSVRLQAGRAFWSDGNKSVTGDFRIQRVLRYSRRLTIDSGPQIRTEAFARYMMPQSGIFTPEFYQCYEGFVGAHGEIGNRVTYEVRSAFGAQRVTGWSDFQMSAEVASSLSVYLTRSLAVSANYTRRNYNVVSGLGAYQGFYVQLGMQP